MFGGLGGPGRALGERPLKPGRPVLEGLCKAPARPLQRLAGSWKRLAGLWEFLKRLCKRVLGLEDRGGRQASPGRSGVVLVRDWSPASQAPRSASARVSGGIGAHHRRWAAYALSLKGFPLNAVCGYFERPCQGSPVYFNHA